MRRIPLLLGAAIVFWGWQTGFLLPAIPMAIAIELPFLVRGRLGFVDRDFERISDLSAVLLAGLTVYQFDAHGFHAIFPILAALPFVFFPLALAQRFSTRDRVSYAALFLSIRRAVRIGRIGEPESIDVAYPFLAACVLAASAGERRPELFFIVLAGLMAWLLIGHRARGARWLPWLASAGLAIGLAYGGQYGMKVVRVSMEPLLMQLFHERLWSRRDPYRSHTAIGHIGRLKISQRIVARIRPAGGQPPPPRLRQAVYRTYSREMWFAPRALFEPIPSVGGGSGWDFAAPSEGAGSGAAAVRARGPIEARAKGSPAPAREVHIATGLQGGRGVLMLPNGTRSVAGLNVDGLTRNGLGAIQVSEGPDLIEFEASYQARERLVDAPTEADLGVPASEDELITRLATELGLPGLSPREAVSRVRDYFRTGFRYSLVRRRGFNVFTTPLADFLERSRSGHCEYYATATVLLLRAAGVPARYAAGYAVNEWSEFEQAFVVRRRHAHSWASVYLDGAWVDVDTTPPAWFDVEAQATPWWTGTYDGLSWLRYKFTQWRYDDSDWIDPRILFGLAFVLAVVLAVRLARTTRVVRPSERESLPPAWPGQDSELYRIEAKLAELLGPRQAGETWRAWLARPPGDPASAPAVEAIHREVLDLHYRYRFDPRGLGNEERQALRLAIEHWLQVHGGEERR